MSNVSAYKWSSALKEGRETVEIEPHERWPRTSKTGKNSDRVDALIRKNRQITVRELSGILNISDGSGKTIMKDSHQEGEKRAQTSVSFLHDNARPHVAACTMDTIQKVKWNVLPHPAYSLGLALTDYHLFDPLKEYLGGKSFCSNGGSGTRCLGVATLATKRLLPVWHLQASGPLTQVYRKPGRLC